MAILASLNYSINISKKVLPNNLLVVVHEDNSNPIVSIQLWIKVGSRNEEPGYTGISHLLEHLMFKGTKRVGPEEYSNEIQKMGGIDNAFTDMDVTVYWSVVPSNKLERVFDLEVDRLKNLVFNDFEEEKNVVMEERRWRVENSPWGHFFEELNALSLKYHPYRNPIIGWMEDLRRITLEDVKSYYHTYYSPQNCVLVVSGDVKAEDVFKLAEKHFGKLKNKNKIHDVIVSEPEFRVQKRFTMKKEGFVTFLGITFPAPSGRDSDYFPLKLLSLILADGKTSRLHKKLVKEKQLVSDVSAWVDLTFDPYLIFIFSTVIHGKSIEEVEKIIFEEIYKLRTSHPPTYEELEIAKNKEISRFIYRQQSVLGKGMMIGTYSVLEYPEKVNEIVNIINSITVDDLIRVANKYLVEEKSTVGYLLPEPPKDIEAYLERLKEAQTKEFRR